MPSGGQTMSSKHRALRQLEYIQQALSQNKRSIGFFVGAGCPLSVRINHREKDGKKISDPLIQDVAGLTAIISSTLKSKDETTPEPYDRILSLMKEDGFSEPNIEQILTQVRSLKSVSGKGDVRGFVEQELLELDKAICKIIAKEVNKELPDDLSPYHNLAIWAQAIEREAAVHIFTTNYDLLIEQAFEESAAPYFDGFIGSKKAFFDLGAVENEKLLHPRWTRLWKVHGSINWRLIERKGKKSVVRSDGFSEDQSYLIYPSHLKYDESRKMPYLAMLDRLKDFLMAPSAVLFILGYSFGDEHINDLFRQTLKANPTAMVYAFMHGSLDQPKYKEAKGCAAATPNIAVLAFDKAIIGRKEGEWEHKEEDGAGNPLTEMLVAAAPPSEGEEQKYELRLGDFFYLGNLLKGLSSNEP